MLLKTNKLLVTPSINFQDSLKIDTNYSGKKCKGQHCWIVELFTIKKFDLDIFREREKARERERERGNKEKEREGGEWEREREIMHCIVLNIKCNYWIFTKHLMNNKDGILRLLHISYSVYPSFVYICLSIYQSIYLSMNLLSLFFSTHIYYTYIS